MESKIAVKYEDTNLGSQWDAHSQAVGRSTRDYHDCARCHAIGWLCPVRRPPAGGRGVWRLPRRERRWRGGEALQAPSGEGSGDGVAEGRAWLCRAGPFFVTWWAGPDIRPGDTYYFLHWKTYYCSCVTFHAELNWVVSAFGCLVSEESCTYPSRAIQKSKVSLTLNSGNFGQLAGKHLIGQNTCAWITNGEPHSKRLNSAGNAYFQSYPFSRFRELP